MNGAGDPVATAQAFVGAVAWGEHTTVWALLGPAAQVAVLDVATRRGMNPLLAARLREGTAADHERDDFLADLLNGLRAELPGVDLDAVRCVPSVDGPTERGSSLVHLVAEVPAELGPPVPVGYVELVEVLDVLDGAGRWTVVRLGGHG